MDKTRYQTVLLSSMPGSPHITVDSLDKLVDDVLIQIIQDLSVHALLSLRRTSRRYYFLSKLRCIWYARYLSDVLDRNLPLPGPLCSLSLLSTAELERRTMRALYLDHAWPRLKANVLVSRHADGPCERVDQVVFIPGGTELLTVHGDKVVHWVIVSWPRTDLGLKYVGKCTPVRGVSCRVVKDSDVPGMIAIGPRKPMRSNLLAQVLSTSLNAPFMMLCDYGRVSGVVVGIWRHFLLLDTTREVVEGGVELLDWRTQATGTVLLPNLTGLFGYFLDFTVFAGHLLVVWERCMSVFSIPQVPGDGQLVVEHKRAFVLQETICRPVGFTTCVAEPRCLDPDGDTSWDWGAQRKPYSRSTMGSPPTLTIIARSKGGEVESLLMVMLIPLVGEEDYQNGAVINSTAFPYRLTYLPHVSATWRSEIGGGEGDVGDLAVLYAAYSALRLGSSGRGIFVVGCELRLVSPGLVVLPPCEMQYGPMFETGKGIYLVDWRSQGDLSFDENAGTTARRDAEEECGDKVDFDEGMGRFVVVTGHGGVEVVQLD